MQPSDLNKRKEYINGRDKRLKQVEEELEQDDDLICNKIRWFSILKNNGAKPPYLK